MVKKNKYKEKEEENNRRVFASGWIIIRSIFITISVSVLLRIGTMEKKKQATRGEKKICMISHHLRLHCIFSGIIKSARSK